MIRFIQFTLYLLLASIRSKTKGAAGCKCGYRTEGCCRPCKGDSSTITLNFHINSFVLRQIDLVSAITKCPWRLSVAGKPKLGASIPASLSKQQFLSRIHWKDSWIAEGKGRSWWKSCSSGERGEEEGCCKGIPPLGDLLSLINSGVAGKPYLQAILQVQVFQEGQQGSSEIREESQQPPVLVPAVSAVSNRPAAADLSSPSPVGLWGGLGGGDLKKKYRIKERIIKVHLARYLGFGTSFTREFVGINMSCYCTLSTMDCLLLRMTSFFHCSSSYELDVVDFITILRFHSWYRGPRLFTSRSLLRKL